MHERLGPWSNGLGDSDLACALLGIGLIPPKAHRDAQRALEALWTTLAANARKVHQWRLDSVPGESGGTSFVPAAPVADAVRASFALGAMRVRMRPGSPLSTWRVWDFLRRHLDADTAALHLASAPPKRPIRFRWPLRIGCMPGPDAQALADELTASDQWGGNVFNAAPLSRRRPECDVLVWTGPSVDMALGDILRGADAIDGALADMVMLLDTSSLEPSAPDLGRLDAIRVAVGAGGVALVPCATMKHADIVRRICAEIAHNHPLDAALSRATSGQGLLMAHKRLLDATHLEGKARALARTLMSPAHAQLGVDPQAFGQWARLHRETAATEDDSLAWQPGTADGRDRSARAAAGAVPRGSGSATPGARIAGAPATRREVGTRLSRTLDSLGWAGESHAASELGRAMRALEDEDDANAEPRYLQAGLARPEAPGEPISGPLKPSTDYAVMVLIDRLQAGYVAGDAAFPPLAPADDERAHDLQVVFWEPRMCPQPQVARMQLPPVGPSERCSFSVRTGADAEPLDARITVLHRNRVLQTGRLTVPVDTEGQPRFRLDAIARRFLTGLDERLNFSMALVLNDVEGRGAAHLMAGDGATVLNVDEDAIAGLVSVIGQAISNITLQPQDYHGLRAPGSLRLLRTLAQKGAILREYLMRHAVRGGRLVPPAYVQVVATRPGKMFPIEFIYQHQAPDMDADICINAEQALRDGECARACPIHRSDAGAMAQTICPLGFWGLRCAIERKAHTPEDNDLPGDYALRMEPVRKARLLHPLASTVVGATDKANLAVPTAVEDMMARISAVVPVAGRVTNWQDLIAAVAANKPATLTLVVHQETDEYGTPMIDIGSRPLLSSDLLKAEHVRAPDGDAPPLVLLIGCETGMSKISYENFALRFQWRGAAAVVCTIAEVLGRQAAPVAAEIIESMSRISTPTSLAEVMRDLRRRLLAEGTPMVLALVAQGDADWEIVGQGLRGGRPC
jgi:hypothetical protein